MMIFNLTASSWQVLTTVPLSVRVERVRYTNGIFVAVGLGVLHTVGIVAAKKFSAGFLHF